MDPDRPRVWPAIGRHSAGDPAPSGDDPPRDPDAATLPTARPAEDPQTLAVLRSIQFRLGVLIFFAALALAGAIYEAIEAALNVAAATR